MQKIKQIESITFDEYAHLPSAIHRLVVDALVERGEWRVVNKPTKADNGGSYDSPWSLSLSQGR